MKGALGGKEGKDSRTNWWFYMMAHKGNLYMWEGPYALNISFLQPSFQSCMLQSHQILSLKEILEIDYLLYLLLVNKELIESSRVGTQSPCLVHVMVGRGFPSCLFKSSSASEGSSVSCFKKYSVNTGLFVSLFTEGLKVPYLLDRHVFNCLLALQIEVRAFSTLVLNVGNSPKGLVFFFSQLEKKSKDTVLIQSRIVL